MTQVLIAGAGPSGLVLALSLARRGVDVRIVSEAQGPGEQSRAMAVHARTLEFYRQFGFADEVVSEGFKAEVLHVREPTRDHPDREVGRFSFKDLGEGISPYPFVLAYPQDAHERLLLRKLEAMGGRVEWGVTLTGFSQDEAGVRAELKHAHGRRETAQAAWLCGCDGAHSQVRHSLGIGFPGGDYEQLFYVADVTIAEGFTTEVRVSLGEEILSLMFPVRGGVQRLIGLVPRGLEGKEIGFEAIRPEVERLLGVHVDEVHWFSTYRTHHRVAERFRVGRAFLLGDAGHIHSPAGGQGMNTGIGDAVNLGWKLADTLDGRGGPALLDSYEPERIAFARVLVESTDRAFTPMVAGGVVGELTRRVLAPLFLQLAARFAWSRHAMFRTVSQVRVHYDDSPLNEGAAGHVRAGERMPWTGAGGPDNFAVLDGLGWRVQLHGEAEPSFTQALAERGLPVDVFSWSAGADHAGMARNGVYLLRPDGHVGWASAAQDASALLAYGDRLGLRFAAQAPSPSSRGSAPT